MAIVRDLNNCGVSITRYYDKICEDENLFCADNYLMYLSTVALFCGISCTILMLRFRGFKASLNVSSGKTSAKNYELAPQVSVVGAYRTNREEYFGNINYLDSRKKITPSMVKLPPNTQTQATRDIKPSRSTGDLTQVHKVPADVRKSTPNVNIQSVAQDNKQSKRQLKEEKKLEKQRLAEQKKREKLAAQEREKQEKLRKEREKQAALQQAKEAKQREKQRKINNAVAAPLQEATAKRKDTRQQISKNTQQTKDAAQKSVVPPPPPQPNIQLFQANPASVSQRPQYSTTTLESSISRSSGPPPYSDAVEIVANNSNNRENTSFGKSSEEASSWDLISQHRQQMSRTGPATNMAKQKRMDLRYNVGNVTSGDKDNSEA